CRPEPSVPLTDDNEMTDKRSRRDNGSRCPARKRHQRELLLNPISTLRGVSERKVVSTSCIFPPPCRKASISACNWARTRARPAMEWLSSLSLVQLLDCSRLLSSNSLMVYLHQRKQVYGWPDAPEDPPRLDCRPSDAPSWRLYNLLS